VRHSFLIFFCALFIVKHGNTQIILQEEFLNTSVAHLAEIAEDKKHEFDVVGVIKTGGLSFRPLEKSLETLDFNSSRWFVRFTVQNTSVAQQIMLETARPITNRVDLFEVENGTVVQIWQSGDGRAFDKKTFEHRKNIFPINFEPNESKTFYLLMESDGEVINLPLIFWEQKQFYTKDYNHQLFHGVYFGMLAVVIFIFFIFYLLLKEISFLYYVLYVFFQLLLQMSLEGFSFQYLFPKNLYWTNNIVLISAAGTVFFVLLYAMNFLKLSARLPKWNRFYKIVLLIILVICAMSLTNTTVLHEISYPIINVVSFIGIVSIVYLIFKLKRQGYAVNNAFALGFIILIAGAVVFILGNVGVLGDAQLSEMSLKISSGLEVLALSVSMAGKYRELQQEKELAQEKALEKLEQLVQERTAEVSAQKEKIEEQNMDIVGSIRYAQRIQGAMLPDQETLNSVLQDHFIFFRPRDIVSGDFYFTQKAITSKGNEIDVFAAVDCTGHGVPGAFMSFIGYNLLQESIKEDLAEAPSKALSFLNEGLMKLLNIKEKDEAGASLRDGMDMALCGLDRKNNILHYAGAKNSLYIITSSNNPQQIPNSKEPLLDITETKMLIEIKADRYPIGLYGDLSAHTFENHSIQLKKGDLIYIFSDGYADQFGGYDEEDKAKKLGTKRFKKLLLETAHLSMDEQLEKITQTFDNWRGPIEQLDDVVLIGVRL
jgi:two-component system, sensor histidine kinase LadS